MKALPNSLATTMGISVDFFSCSYLDVSVHCVRSTYPMYSGKSDLAVGFPHSEISGSKLYCQLPEAYRRLTRPSSPVVAKASTTCTYSLDPGGGGAGGAGARGGGGGGPGGRARRPGAW